MSGSRPNTTASIQSPRRIVIQQPDQDGHRGVAASIMKIAEHNRGFLFLQELRIFDTGTAFRAEAASLRDRESHRDARMNDCRMNGDRLR